MPALDLYQLRNVFTAQQIMLCFNGPFSATLIDEIGKALRNHMEGLSESPSAVSDVFSVYIELTQNIRNYSQTRNFTEEQSIATVVVARTPDGRYTVSAGNVVHLADGESLLQRVEALSHLDKNELKAAFKAQLRQPRDTLTGPGAGLGLIDMARKASEPLAATVQALPDGLSFFSLRVTL